MSLVIQERTFTLLLSAGVCKTEGRIKCRKPDLHARLVENPAVARLPRRTLESRFAAVDGRWT